MIGVLHSVGRVVDVYLIVFEKENLVLQTTVGEPGKYLIYIVAKKGTSILHRFYLKDSSQEMVQGHEYHVVTMRIPAELRGSRLYIKLFKAPA